MYIGLEELVVLGQKGLHCVLLLSQIKKNGMRLIKFARLGVSPFTVEVLMESRGRATGQRHQTQISKSNGLAS
jgi:hypothetical protein